MGLDRLLSCIDGSRHLPDGPSFGEVLGSPASDNRSQHEPDPTRRVGPSTVIPTGGGSISNMTRLDGLRREAAEYLAELDAERERVQGFLTGLRPVLDEADTETTPQGTDNIPATTRTAARTGGDAAYALRVMTARADVDEWDTPLLLSTLRADGWTTDARSVENAVSAILSRLARAGQIERRRRGRYAVPRSINAESPAVAGLSVGSDLAPEGGEHTKGQGSHHDHRDDLAGRNDDRDHLGAPVGH